MNMLTLRACSVMLGVEVLSKSYVNLGGKAARLGGLGNLWLFVGRSEGLTKQAFTTFRGRSSVGRAPGLQLFTALYV